MLSVSQVTVVIVGPRQSPGPGRSRSLKIQSHHDGVRTRESGRSEGNSTSMETTALRDEVPYSDYGSQGFSLTGHAAPHTHDSDGSFAVAAPEAHVTRARIHNCSDACTLPRYTTVATRVRYQGSGFWRGHLVQRPGCVHRVCLTLAGRVRHGTVCFVDSVIKVTA